MHVAYIHQHFATPDKPGGTRSYEFSRRLLARGHRVTLIAGGHRLMQPGAAPQEPVTELDIDGIEAKYVNVYYSNELGAFRRWIAFSRFARAAEALAVRSGADLVFATSTPLHVGKPGMRAARRLGAPFVFEVRDIWPKLLIEMGVLRNPLVKWRMRQMELSFYRAAERVIVLAPGMTGHICDSGVPREKITFIPNCCDLDLFGPDRTPSDHPVVHDDAFRLVFTGAHGRANGLDAVLDAAVELKRRGVSGVRFVLIGSGGMKPRLMERAREEDLGGLTAFHPPVSKIELAGILAHVDVGMQILANVPGFYNGTSPNKFFDYIASGLPVLNNYPGWLAELIESNNCGVVVPPDDPSAFADAVLRMRDHPDELQTMGRNARALAEREFSRDMMGERFAEALEKAAGTA